jgi:hypothetical protein
LRRRRERDLARGGHDGLEREQPRLAAGPRERLDPEQAVVRRDARAGDEGQLGGVHAALATASATESSTGAAVRGQRAAASVSTASPAAPRSASSGVSP